ncbi:MAG: hypothetical protein EXX96DRAFT_588203 [Benjaminiella poitrasii]|nr:MAG: hypothetical protein EXX96DRAFT_588203 [Benjaminiella poitrasii]
MSHYYQREHTTANRIDHEITIPFNNNRVTTDIIHNERPILPPILSNSSRSQWSEEKKITTTTTSFLSQQDDIWKNNTQHYYNNTAHISNISTSQPPKHINTPVELILTPNSLSTPSLRNVEKDIEEVIKHCNSLVDNMNGKKQTIIENDDYFGNSSHMRPWLDDMISKANEVLNALLRLRKYQLAAEYARIHRTNTVAEQSRMSSTIAVDGRRVVNEASWGPSKNSLIPSSSLITLNSNRLRKRGKRPVFQGRCHSCNISETPEWRRGPDGARTLCNACGLHYAKLSKKKNMKKEESSIEDDTSMK